MPVIPPQPWLEHLFEHVPVARTGEDPEGVHQLRVATRRLDAWLRLAGWRVLRDDLRWLRRIAGEVRDHDVLLERHGDGGLGAWLRGRREHAREALLAGLDGPRWAGLRQALALLPPLERDDARRGFARIAKRVAKRGEEAEASEGDGEDAFEAWHALRRGARRLRYALEWLDAPTAPLRELQDELGELGDLALARRHLACHPDPTAVEAVLADVDARLAPAFERARAGWSARRDEILGATPWTSS